MSHRPELLPERFVLPEVRAEERVPWDEVPGPAFVIDEGRMRRNLAIIAEVQRQSGAQIILAFKGFANWPLFGLFREMGITGATASSLNEVILASEEFGGEVHTYAPAYSDGEFSEILRRSDHIVFNSLNQHARFAEQIEKARAEGKKIHIGLRINPEYAEVETDLYNPAGTFSRLGIVRRAFDRLPDGVDGLHFHSLCEKNSDTLERTLQVIEQNWGEVLQNEAITWVNFGGGHLMTRSDYDTRLLIKLVQEFSQKYGVQVILEPGSAFAWDCGWLISSVLDIVDNGKKTAILDVSFSAHMPDVLEMPYRPRVLGASDPVSEHREASEDAHNLCALGGTTCLAGDFIGEYAFETPLKIGDRVLFNDMIHYTTVKTTFFNGVRHPRIVLWKENGELVTLADFGYEQFRAKLGFKEADWHSDFPKP